MQHRIRAVIVKVGVADHGIVVAIAGLLYQVANGENSLRKVLAEVLARCPYGTAIYCRELRSICLIPKQFRTVDMQVVQQSGELRFCLVNYVEWRCLP